MKTFKQVVVIIICVFFLGVANPANARTSSILPAGAGPEADVSVGASTTAPGVIINWTKATDNISAPSALVYEVRQSTSRMDTVAIAEAIGVIIQPYTADVATANVSGLAPSTSYFFNVIVKDQAGNKAVYASTGVTTAASTSAGPGVTLNWTKATDNMSASSALVYEVRQSTSRIDTVATAEANGVVIQSYTADVATVNITGLAPSTAYFFNVIVKDQAGNKAIYASTGVTTAALPFAPVITTQPVNRSVTVGQTATFSVVATGNPTPTVQWKKGGVNISGATSASYTTPVTALADSGSTFQVVVTNAAGNVTSNSATLTATAAAVAPAITTQPANQSVTVGQTATFSVVATGTPAPTYQWRKGGVSISGATSASYTTAVTVLADSGSTFQVVVTNSAGSVTSNSATLTATAAAVAPAITTQPANRSVTVGQTATFSVVATGTPAPTYQWRRSGVSISGATSATYTTAVTVLADSGSTFQVVVTNSAGSVTSNNATLTATAATAAPAITTQPANQSVTVGQTATFSVVATGTPAPTYQWAKGGVNITGATSASYTTSVTALADNGSTFKVVVTNSAGSITSSNATLTATAATAAPAITTQPADQTVAVGQTATFTVAATGASLKYQWKKGSAKISGATSATYSVNGTTKDNGAKFQVVVTNSTGSATSNSATLWVKATAAYQISTDGGVSLTTASTTDSTLNISHALIMPDTQAAIQVVGISKIDDSVVASGSLTQATDAIAGVAIIGLRQGGVLVTEAGVPASTEIVSGRIYAEIQGPVNTGIALSNFDELDALVSFSFTDSNGNDFGAGSFTLPANHQMAAFLNQAPFNGRSEMQGSFTFRSSVPVGAIALHGLANERGEFLITTLPVTPLGAGMKTATLPHFADGGGWTTQVALTNASDATQTGTVQFFGPGAQGQVTPSLSMTVNGATANTFSYSIPPHASTHLTTAGTASGTQVGSVRISAADSVNGDVPSATAIFSFRNGGVTVGETGVSAMPTGTAFRIYTESVSTAQTGSIQSGVAIANPSEAAIQVSMELTNLDGSYAGVPSASVNVPAGGQVAKFINELFPNIPATFRGIAKVTAASPIALTGLRSRYNERGDFLITTTPPMNDATPATGVLLFPHIVTGSGYSTQIVIYGQPGSGELFMLGQDGATK